MTLELKQVIAKHGQFYVFPEDIYIGRSLETYGQWCEAEVELFQKILHPGACVVEVGANIGSHTVPLAKAVGPAGVVFAIEMQPFVAQVLSTNVLINDITNVHVVNAGVGAERSEMRVPLLNYGLEYNYGGISMGFLESKEGNIAQTVSCAPLDDLLTLARLDLLKLDVEKLELAALEGARGHIDKHRPVIYLECDDPEQASGILAFLQSYDYQCFWHRSFLWDPNNTAGQTENVFGNQRCVNLLAVPAGRKVEGFEPAPNAASHPKHSGR